MCMYIPSISDCPSNTSPPSPALLCHHRAWAELLMLYGRFPLASYLTHANVYIVCICMILSFMSCFFILKINPSSVVSLANISSHCEDYLFVLFMVSFDVENLFFFFDVENLLGLIRSHFQVYQMFFYKATLHGPIDPHPTQLREITPRFLSCIFKTFVTTLEARKKKSSTSWNPNTPIFPPNKPSFQPP